MKFCDAELFVPVAVLKQQSYADCSFRAHPIDDILDKSFIILVSIYIFNTENLRMTKK
jgi:hypothetical protein